MWDPVRTGIALNLSNAKPVAPPLQVLVKAHHEVDYEGELYLRPHPAKQMNPASCERMHVATADPIDSINIR
jgi:hypothetical protein